MRGRVISLGLIMSVIATAVFSNRSSNNQRRAVPLDSARRIFEIEIKSNLNIKGLKDLDIFDIYHNTLFIAANDRLFELDLTTGK
jgi:hypothetical protein